MYAKTEGSLRAALLTLLLGCVCTLACGGCVSFSASDRADMQVIKDAGLDPQAHQIKSPVLAGCLNILPGFGNFYLGFGSGDEKINILYGVLNLLTWPYSVLWGIPQVAIDAGTMNNKETIFYYMKTEQGRNELRSAQDRQRGSPGNVPPYSR